MVLLSCENPVGETDGPSFRERKLLPTRRVTDDEVVSGMPSFITKLPLTPEFSASERESSDAAKFVLASFKLEVAFASLGNIQVCVCREPPKRVDFATRNT